MERCVRYIFDKNISIRLKYKFYKIVERPKKIHGEGCWITDKKIETEEDYSIKENVKVDEWNDSSSLRQI